MVKSKFTFFQYFRKDQTWSNISQNKVNIAIFLSQGLQRRPCPCKLSSWYVPHTVHYGKTTSSHWRHITLNVILSLRIFAVGWFSGVVKIAPVLLTRRFSSSQNHKHVLFVRIPTGYSLELSQNLPHLILFKMLNYKMVCINEMS